MTTITMTKAARVVVKAAGPDDNLAEGEFVALVSVFNNVDTYGDVVMPGAFSDVLADYRAKGVPIPVVWSHDWTDPFSHIGYADPTKARETDEGLEVTGTLDIDSPVTAAAEKAQQVYRLMSERRVAQFSFAFDIADAGWGVRGEGDEAREVFELRKFAALHEVGPCLVGVNQATRLEQIKARDAAYPRPKASDPDPADEPDPKASGSTADPDPADDAPTAGDAKADDPASVALRALALITTSEGK